MKELTSKNELKFDTIEPSLTEDKTIEFYDKLMEMVISSTGVPPELLKVNK